MYVYVFFLNLMHLFSDPTLAASSAIQQEGLDEKCPKSHGLLVFFLHIVCFCLTVEVAFWSVGIVA